MPLSRFVQGPTPIRGRLIFFGLAGALGALTFLPFLSAGTGLPAEKLIAFPIVVTVAATIAAWVGLRCADSAGLPMPYLRRLDGGAKEAARPSAFLVTLVSCGLLGVMGIVALRTTGAPALPGDVGARALSTFFAAGPLETVIHLFIMSVAVWVSRRRWVGIASGALALVLFHLGDASSAPPTLVAAMVVGNGLVGVVLGTLYSAYGFEFAMLGHGVAHLITLMLG